MKLRIDFDCDSYRAYGYELGEAWMEAEEYIFEDIDNRKDAFPFIKNLSDDMQKEYDRTGNGRHYITDIKEIK